MSNLSYEPQIEEYVKRKRYRQINRIILWQDNKILAEQFYNGYQENSKNVIKSVAKSIMSIAVGIAIDKQNIKSLDDPISNYLKEFAENRDMLHRQITIRHLLTMTSGIYWNGGLHYHCPMLNQMQRSKNWISHIADIAVTNRPGEQYLYKEWDIILLGKVLDQACGDMYNFIQEHLYQPLGIESQRWYQSPCGAYYSVALGDEGDWESSSNLSAYDMLKIGQLFLNQGNYKGKQIVSKEYIDQATAPSLKNQGYGFLWWRGDNWFGCRGYGGQNITVIPDKKAIFIMQATPTSRGMGYDDVAWYCLDLLQNS